MSLSGVAGSLVALAVTAGCGGQSFSQGGDDGDAGDGASSGGTAGAAGVGGSGSGGSGTAGSSAGNAGAGGSSGSAGSSSASCDDPDQSALTLRQGAETRSTTVGTNGSFTDRCNLDGDLVEYACQSGCRLAKTKPNEGSGPGVSAAPCLPASAEVMPVIVDCAGRCVEGTCFNHCPNETDTFTVTTVDTGRIVLTRDDGFPYDCVSVGGDAAGTIDCLSTDLLGEVLKITLVVGCDATEAVIGVAPVDGGVAGCAYACSPAVASSR